MIEKEEELKESSKNIEEPIEKPKEKTPSKHSAEPKKRTVSMKNEKPKKKYICRGIWHGKLALISEDGNGWLIDIPEGYENAQSGQIIEL